VVEEEEEAKEEKAEPPTRAPKLVPPPSQATAGYDKDGHPLWVNLDVCALASRRDNWFNHEKLFWCHVCSFVNKTNKSFTTLHALDNHLNAKSGVDGHPYHHWGMATEKSQNAMLLADCEGFQEWAASQAALQAQYEEPPAPAKGKTKGKTPSKAAPPQAPSTRAGDRKTAQVDRKAARRGQPWHSELLSRSMTSALRYGCMQQYLLSPKFPVSADGTDIEVPNSHFDDEQCTDWYQVHELLAALNLNISYDATIKTLRAEKVPRTGLNRFQVLRAKIPEGDPNPEHWEPAYIRCLSKDPTAAQSEKSGKEPAKEKRRKKAPRGVRRQRAVEGAAMVGMVAKTLELVL